MLLACVSISVSASRAETGNPVDARYTNALSESESISSEGIFLFPDFPLTETASTVIRKSTSNVHDNNTDTEEVSEAARVQWNSGETTSLSATDCNSDEPDDFQKQRDNFFGSAWVPEEVFHDDWTDAEYFRTLTRLSPSQSSVVLAHQTVKTDTKGFFNSATEQFSLTMQDDCSGDLGMHQLSGQAFGHRLPTNEASHLLKLVSFHQSAAQEAQRCLAQLWPDFIIKI